jgi:DNA-binding NtrC family response regulator
VARVLVVDDDYDIGDALSELFTMEGHHIRVARDGVHGLALLEEERPDIVLLDVDLPRLSGPQMARQMVLRNHGLEQIPIVLLSGIPDLARVAARVGTPYFLAKPYDFEALLEITSRALAERTAPRSELEARP